MQLQKILTSNERLLAAIATVQCTAIHQIAAFT